LLRHSRGLCATRLHNRNAACPRLPASARSDPKGDSDVCAPRVHKFGPGTHTPGGPSRKRLCARETHGSCHPFAIARALPSPTMFALYSLSVKLLFCPGRIRKAESRASQEFHLREMLFTIASNGFDGLAAHDGFKAPERQISRLALDRQRLCLPGFVGLIALGFISTIRPTRRMSVGWTRRLLFR